MRVSTLPQTFFLSLLCILFSSSISQGQQGYAIKFKIDGLKDTTAYLGYYYGESTFIKDTAKINSKGEFKFDGNDLPQGVYFLVLDRTRLFEFVVGATQTFTMETGTEDYVKKMKVTGDLDNKLFFENMVFNVERHKEADPFMKVIQDSTLAEDKKKDARDAFAKINDQVVEYQNGIIAKYPKTLTARIFKASQAVKIPDPPKKPDGTIDSTFQLRWYREHFFDNFDLADDAFIRMPRPMYSEKINEYLDKLYAPHPDTITLAIKRMVEKAKKNQETYKFLVWICTIKYQSPEIMGLDEVYVNLFDTYYEKNKSGKGEMDFWVNDKLKKNLKEHADKLRKSMIGKQAPNLIMQDVNLQKRSMYDITKKYTILYIFDPDCGHCKKETPKLIDFYSKTKFSVEVFAVSADSSIAKLKDYIKEMKMPWITVNGPRSYVGNYQKLYDAETTPTIYVLDNKKKIIAKKLAAENLDDFLIKYEKYHKEM